MYIGSDVSLRGDIWNETLDRLKPIIETNYGVYVLSVAIGIFADKQLETLATSLSTDSYRSIPRSILHNNVHIFDLLFKSAIITTATVSFPENERMELAFNDDSKSENAKSFGKMAFLTKFANYGVTQLAKRITDDPLENIEALNKYIVECADGLGFDDFDFVDLDISEASIGGFQ
jgi:hypothetical protein